MTCILYYYSSLLTVVFSPVNCIYNTLSMLLDFSIDNLTKVKGRKFKSRLKWHSATSTMIEKKRKKKLDSLLMLIQLPFTVLHCENV